MDMVADPAAPDAVSGGLDTYAMAASGADLFGASGGDMRHLWRQLATGLGQRCNGDFAMLNEQLAHLIQDLGMAFRIAGDVDERPWPLGAMPLLISGAEWAGIEAGLIQRAELLERVIADIYGPQLLVRDGRLPAAVISGSHHFSRKMIGAAPADRRFLHVYAVELARGPTGEWRVLADRLRLPTGIGYALENRLALSRSTGSLLTDIHTRRLARFFAAVREGLAASAVRTSPRLALLSPGRFNQSYPEQAHLARYLGLLLVEGRDLMVSDRKLYVRTIAGPKQIDALWRWIDTRHLDPLAFDAQSRIGVAGIFDACASGNLAMANWPGVGVLESRAFSAFLPRLARLMLGEPLKLPNVATWWCGQQRERQTVIDGFDRLVISSAFGGNPVGLDGGKTRAGASFSAEEKRRLLAAMDLRPMDYAGQEVVHLSTTPALIDGGFAPRPFTMRAFVARDGQGNWVVMPGGFARLSARGDLRTSLMGAGDISADVCIVDTSAAPDIQPITVLTHPQLRRATGQLPAQAADNLFWFARYSERAEITVRIVRALLDGSIDVDSSGGRGSAALVPMIRLLKSWGALADEKKSGGVSQICHQVLNDEGQFGSVAALLATARDIGRGLRDRMAMDFWRIANSHLPRAVAGHAEAMHEACNILVDRMSALAGLAAENMGRGAAWRFYDLGRRVERAINGVRLAIQLGGAGDTGQGEADALNMLLELHDSHISYRSRYLFGAVRAPVLDLTVLDPHNPRAMMFQIEHIAAHLEALPSLDEGGLPEPQVRAARELLGLVQGLDAQGIDGAALRRIEQALLNLSGLIAARYFLPVDAVAKPAIEDLPA